MRTSLAPRAAVLSFARRAAVVGSSTLLLAAPLTASAHAEPTDPVGSSGAGVTQLSADELPADLVEAITRDLQISPQEYLDRAARAQELGSYAADFRAERPEEFAGAWMGLDGHPVVAVTTTEAAQDAARDGYRTHMAPVSLEGLEQSVADFNRWVSDLPREIASQVGSASIDVLNNQIVVDIANSPAGRALDLPTQIANVKVQLSNVGPAPVERTPMGGDTYVTSAKPLGDAPRDEIGICSFGFNGVDRNGNAVNISAGHCDPAQGANAGVYLPNRENLADSLEVGKFARSEIGGNDTIDYSLIRLNDAGLRVGLDRPVIRGAGGSTLTVTGTAVPVVGAPICKSGQTSSFTCGVVSADRVEAQLMTFDGASHTVRGFAGTACTLAGDSGGAIVTGTLALGITSGSNSSDAPSCAEANMVLAFDGGTSNLGIPIRTILGAADASSGGGLGAGLSVRTGAAGA
ncbi:protease [Prescottella agglutinans]|uniref:Protease n=1 Tax=Prescottella agglutinans TaxID=1644129 RepID=A0A3S3AIX2_9NOCA|nr:S1 family peptidase [Prescottella agglutinans]RVW09307.1 protease [Prescottella agglutinans]